MRFPLLIKKYRSVSGVNRISAPAEKKLHLRPAGRNVRIVVPDAAPSGADRAPLVRAAIGFTHQVEESRRWRRGMEPVVEPGPD